MIEMGLVLEKKILIVLKSLSYRVWIIFKNFYYFILYKMCLFNEKVIFYIINNIKLVYL